MMLSEVLHDSRISRLVELALMEDIGLGDLTTDAVLSEDAVGKAEFSCKEQGIIAGLEVAALVFQYCDSSLTLSPQIRDGEFARSGRCIATVDGKTQGILRGERTALNFLQRMSGIATLTKIFVDAVEGTGARITDTRKTVPGLRVLDKWAVRIGGGVNHRFGLDDMVLIKDNHIVAAGGIVPAVQRCRAYMERTGVNVRVEVETSTLAEVEEALTCDGIHRIMLDNFPLGSMRQAVERVGGKVELEASGGVTRETVRSIAETGVQYISIGALTHSVSALDISLELKRTTSDSDHFSAHA
jgi:nicotinate-nucleotide pyrophosphorylase (carboxylating)